MFREEPVSAGAGRAGNPICCSAPGRKTTALSAPGLLQAGAPRPGCFTTPAPGSGNSAVPGITLPTTNTGIVPGSALTMRWGVSMVCAPLWNAKAGAVTVTPVSIWSGDGITTDAAVGAVAGKRMQWRVLLSDEALGAESGTPGAGL